MEALITVSNLLLFQTVLRDIFYMIIWLNFTLSVMLQLNFHFHLFHNFILRYGDHYAWNKVTTCIHNILSGRRWIEHYGEITIRNTKSSICICKLTFVKVTFCDTTVKCLSVFPSTYLSLFFILNVMSGHILLFNNMNIRNNSVDFIVVNLVSS